jgi:hypothetical protein
MLGIVLLLPGDAWGAMMEEHALPGSMPSLTLEEGEGGTNAPSRHAGAATNDPFALPADWAPPPPRTVVPENLEAPEKDPLAATGGMGLLEQGAWPLTIVGVLLLLMIGGVVVGRMRRRSREEDW